MKHIRRIAVPAYGVAAILVLYPAMELVQAAWPMRPDTLAWRVGAIGLVSRTLVTPILALLLAYCVALLLEQPRVLRALAGVSAVLGAVVVVGLVFYALDAFQVRTQIAPQTKTAFDLGLTLSFVKFGIGSAFLGGLAVTEWRAASAITRGGLHATSPRAQIVARPSVRGSAAAAGNGMVAPAQAMPAD